MQIRVIYLGGSRQAAGLREESIEVANGSSLRDAVETVAARHTALKPHLPFVRWACNNRFAADDLALCDGDELALVPPVAGGAPKAWISDAPLDVNAVQQGIAGPDVGACVMFVGTVRDNNGGSSVQALRYEAYEPMATQELLRIVEDCEAEHPDARVTIAHRVGELAVGETSVVIAAASPHRDEAFSACRDALERLKTDVPIYKEETRDAGAIWIGWGGG
jgi:MoaE-MoaD fusion protein